MSDLFWKKVDKNGPGGCWLWTGAIRDTGYGAVRFNGKTARSHRVAYVLSGGTIPDGLDLCHRCDVRHCVNPDHLFPGTRTDNMRDASEKGRCVLPPIEMRQGEANVNAKLNPDKVRAIRAAVAVGEKRKLLAARFGVSECVISEVVTRRTWKHVA